MFPQLGESGRSEKRRQMRPPPNFSSRRVQWRLLMLVFGVMFVLLAMQKVSDPEFWSFMGFADEKPAGEQKEKAPADFDSRLELQPDGTYLPVEENAVDEDEDAEDEDDKPDTRSALDRIWYDGWEEAIEKRNESERLLLAKVLKHVRDGAALGEAEQQTWLPLVGKLDTHWESYLETAWNALAKLKDDEKKKKATWQRALQQVETEWNLHWKETLAAAADPTTLSGEAKTRLHDLQLLLDEVALAHVADHTISLHPRDRETRYRLLDKLNHMSQEEIQASSTGPVGIIQLLRQPEHYRGKVVTIRGTAKLANRVKAPDNVFGIEQWYVFWVRPVGGSPQPYTVYTLEVPDGFPKIDDQETELDEDVQFTGYFFRNGAYAADVVRTRPVLLAKMPTWKPSLMEKVEVPTAAIIVLTVVGIAVIAVGIAVVIYARSRRTPEIVTKYNEVLRNNSEGLDSLANNDQAADVQDVLRQLSEED